MTKETLLQQTDPEQIIDIIARFWPQFPDEEAEELCIEEIYELIAHSAETPPDFHLLSDAQKAQHEIDIDMLLITITFKAIGDYLFKEQSAEDGFWEAVGKRSKRDQKVFKKLFD